MSLFNILFTPVHIGDFTGVAEGIDKVLVHLDDKTPTKKVAEETRVSDWLEDLFS